MQRYGDGLVNSAINNLPVELHIPGYKYCGPGTKLQKRLARGEKGINGLDEACKNHDISYSQTKDLNRRHEADRILAEKAMTRFKAKDSSLGEKMAALAVAGTMKAKVKLGMGLQRRNRTPLTANIKRKCIQLLSGMNKRLTDVTKNIEECLKLLNSINGNKIIRVDKKKSKTKRLPPPPPPRRKRLIIDNKEENEPMDIDIIEDLKRATKRKFLNDIPVIPDKKMRIINSRENKPKLSAKRKNLEQQIESDIQKNGSIEGINEQMSQQQQQQNPKKRNLEEEFENVDNKKMKISI
ncbi:uncharacterized protein isoform X2 [Leptinotarsa decemlineata]|uniref:uncharacterized protein isoform X2 n=1 Tax=Leptinotarsa decemlineata TaxID=7539 RepID=UPI003D30801E